MWLLRSAVLWPSSSNLALSEAVLRVFRLYSPEVRSRTVTRTLERAHLLSLDQRKRRCLARVSLTLRVSRVPARHGTDKTKRRAAGKAPLLATLRLYCNPGSVWRAYLGTFVRMTVSQLSGRTARIMQSTPGALLYMTLLGVVMHGLAPNTESMTTGEGAMLIAFFLFFVFA